ncbi:MAG: hypothetical protein ACM31P_19990 [Actinomycetota bacterium]
MNDIAQIEENKDDQESKGTKLWILYLALFAVFATWACSGIILYPLDETKRGTFGDMFGAVNSLFSGLAFAALIFTVFMQREELSLQRRELEYTRIELRRSAKAQEQSEVALKAQAEAAAQQVNLAAVNLLLSYYREELAKIRKDWPAGVPSDLKARFTMLRKREEELVSILDTTYHKVTIAQANAKGEPFPVFPVKLSEAQQ